MLRQPKLASALVALVVLLPATQSQAGSMATHAVPRHGATSLRVSSQRLPRDLAPGQWNANVTALPLALGYTAAARSRNGNLFIFGGFYAVNGTINQVSSTAFVYVPRANKWAAAALMPAPVEAAQAVRMNDGRILVMGGDSGGSTTPAYQPYRAAYVYTPSTNSWSTAAQMLTARTRFVAALGRDGRVYAIGGWDGTTALSSVEAYDPQTNQWSPVVGLPQAEVGPAGTTDGAGNIVVMGGYNGSNSAPIYYNSVYIYTGKGWRSGAPMPTPREDFAVTLGKDGGIYAIAGFGSSKWVSTVEVYDPRRNAWGTIAPLPSPRCCLSAATALDGRIFAFGGDGPRAEVDVYRPAAG